MTQPGKYRPNWVSFTGGFTDLVRLAGFLGGARDTILVLAAAVYFVGYIVWAVNAWKNGLGLLPAADLQYFVAGILPCVVLATAFVLLRLIIAATTRLRFYTSTLNAQTRRNLDLATVVLAILTIAAGTAKSWLGISDFVATLFWLTGIAFFVFLPILGLQETSDSRTMNLFNRVRVWYSVAVSIRAYLVGLYVVVLLLMNVVYPAVPQKLGGIRPRCAHLEVETSNMSKESIGMFFQNLDTELDAGTLRTGEVEIVYSRGDILMVRPPGANPSQIHQFRGGVIRAIVGCG